MNRYFKIFLSLGLLIAMQALPMYAETVSRSEASRHARIFFNKMFGTDEVKPEFVYSGRNLTTDRLFSPFYVFNRKGGGYVIISAENKAYPVLGFGRENKFEYGGLKAEEKERLAEFAHDIEITRYDPRMPVKATEAWIDFPQYAENLLAYGHKELLLQAATEFNYATETEGEDDVDDLPFPEPFTFYEEFMAYTRGEENRKLEIIDELLNPSGPQITQGGTDSFTVIFPEEMIEGKVYNLQGGVVDMLTIKDSGTVVVKLDREMPGFYVALFHGKSGRPYGLKLYKSK